MKNRPFVEKATHRRWLSILLILWMVFSLVPIVTRAEGVSVIKIREGETLEELAAGEYAENHGTIVTNNGTVTDNYGTVTTNNGTVTRNYGQVVYSYGTISTNKYKDGVKGSVYVNYGTVSVNEGTIELNRNLVEGNHGAVDTNLGIVINQSGGTVATNSSEVYNYGGTVGSSTSSGTEYFKVNIQGVTDNVTVSSTGLTSAYNMQWLGQTAGIQTTATITVTPASNWEIKTITGLPDNVTAVKNAYGTWTLTVTSGKNTTIKLPQPTLIKYTLTVNNGSGGGEYVISFYVTITANAAPSGKQFKEWTGADGLFFDSGSATTATAAFYMPEHAVTVTATYEDIYPVTVNNGSGSGNYAEGASVTITANDPPEGQQFREWTGADGLTFTSGSATTATATFTMPANAVMVTATYGGYHVYLFATEDDGAIVTGAGDYEEGAVVTLGAQPSEGHYFIRWDVNSGGVTITNGQFTMPANDVIIIGRFGLLYDITLAVSPAGCGTVTASPAAAPAGTQVTLTAAPNSGYHFKEWRVVSGNITIENDQFSMPAEAVTVTAVFVGETPYQITSDSTVAASVFDGWTGSEVTQAVHGEELSLSLTENATPQAGCYFTGEFKVDGASLGREYDENHVFSWPITDFTMPNHDVSIAAAQAQRESMTLDFSQCNVLTMDYIAWVQLQSHDNIVIISDEDWNEFIDLDNSGTPDLAVTASDGVTTSDYTLALLQDADAVGSFSFTFTGSEDRFSQIVVMITVPSFGPATFTLPAALTTIEANAFEGDTFITAVDAHNCTSIGAEAFKGCTGLTQIRVHQNCQINASAFTGCGTVYVFAPAGGAAETSCADIDNCVFVAEAQN